MDRNYNLNELAMITGFTTRTLRTYLNKGLLKGTKIDGVWQFSEAEIDQFLSEPFVKEGLRIKRNAVVFDFLADAGRKDGKSGLRGWNFKYGSTGILSLGNGLFYISENSKTKEGLQQTVLRLYRWTGDPDGPFVPEK